MNPPAGATRWRPADSLIWTQFDDSETWVVYNPASAQVHELTDAARRLWMAASDGAPHTLDDLSAFLANAAGRTADEELIQRTRETLNFLDEVGLLAPEPA